MKQKSVNDVAMIFLEHLYRALKVMCLTVLGDIPALSVVLRPGQANGLGIVDIHSIWGAEGQLT